MVLSTNLIPPEAESSELSRRDFQSRLSGLGKLDANTMSEAQKEKKLREACEGFESIFIQKMWQEMRNTLPKSNLLQGREEQFWQGMYDQELAKKMTSAGGIGLANMMYAQLSQNLVSASRASAASGPLPGQQAFAPEAAPMLPEAAAAPVAQDVPAGTVGRDASAGQRGQPLAQVYDGAAPLQDAGRVEDAGRADARMPESSESGGAARNPPEVDQALAALRAQQAADPAHSRLRRTSLTSTAAPNMNSGLNLARMAQFEAGSKLGTNAVRPPLRQIMGLGNNTPGQDGAAQAAGQPANPQPAAQPEAASVQAIAPLTASGVVVQPMDAPLPVQAGVQTPQPGAFPPPQVVERSGQPAAAPLALQPQKVRYTTNIPPKGGNKKQNVIRMLNVDAVGPNSKAGAGLAAYHAQQAAAAAPLPEGAQAEARVSPQPMPLTGQALVQGVVSPASQSGGQISVHQGGQAPSLRGGAQEGAGAMAIPPLTAADTQKSSPGPY